jgi:hypothetical protein
MYVYMYATIIYRRTANILIVQKNPKFDALSIIS